MFFFLFYSVCCVFVCRMPRSMTWIVLYLTHLLLFIAIYWEKRVCNESCHHNNNASCITLFHFCFFVFLQFYNNRFLGKRVSLEPNGAIQSSTIFLLFTILFMTKWLYSFRVHLQKIPRKCELFQYNSWIKCFLWRKCLLLWQKKSLKLYLWQRKKSHWKKWNLFDLKWPIIDL